jgi:N4-(beta-N-acetylglucosaminyl)-L-asparaginase
MNALRGMKRAWRSFAKGGDPLDAAIEVVKVLEADPSDRSVGLGGLPNEDGVVQLDAAVMHGPTHNSGAVGCIENIMHPSEVARLVMERTDHCMIVGEGAYRFARSHGHPHVELLTEETRKIWMNWKESMSDRDDRLPPLRGDERSGSNWTESPSVLARREFQSGRVTGTIHCSAVNAGGDVGCTTTTSGLSWKIPGRVGDSPIIGAGLYCDNEVGSAGATGRGEAAILSNASAMCVELMRAGASPAEAGLEVMARVVRQARRAASWQASLVDEGGNPAFSLRLYVLSRTGEYAGVALNGEGSFSVAGAGAGPRHEPVVAYL